MPTPSPPTLTHGSPVTSNNVTPANSTWWPPLKNALLSRELKLEDLKIDCPICRDRCTVLEHEINEDGLDHATVIFPCGHIFGHSCINKHIYDLVITQGGKARCPFCREIFHHTECGHLCLGYLIPLDEERMKTLPEVLNRDGGSISPKCHKCWLRDLAKDLRREICKLYGDTFRDQLEVSVKSKKSEYCTRENDDDHDHQLVIFPLEFINHLNSIMSAHFCPREWGSDGRTDTKIEIRRYNQP